MTEFIRPVPNGSVDGVAAWWGDGTDQTFRASLAFRFGQIDQRLIEHGWMELLLRLTADGVDVPPYLSVEAAFGPEFTHISVLGPPEEAGALLSSLAARIWRPDPGRIAATVEALRQEQKPDSALGDSLFRRFGASGLGVSSMARLGLYSVTPERLDAFARQVFTRQNAVVALNAPPPASLRLDLPDGTYRPCPEPRQIIVTPAAFATSESSVVLSGCLPRSISAMLLVRILDARAMASLRHTDGISYSPQGGYFGAGDVAITSLVTDVQPGAAAQAADTMVAALAQLAAEGPDPRELEEHRRAYVQGLGDPATAEGLPWAHALAALTRRPPTDPETLEAEALAVTAESITRDAIYWRNSALIGAPHATTLPEGYPLLDMPTEPPLENVTSAHASLDPDMDPAIKRTILLSPEGISETDVHGTFTVRFADALAMLAWPDGKRTTFGSAGWFHGLEPTLWVDGHDITAALDAAIPPELVAHLPARDPQEIPLNTEVIELPKQIKQTRARLRLLPWQTALLVLFFGGLDLAMTLQGTAGIHALLMVGAPIVALMVVAIVLTRRRLTRLEDQLARARSAYPPS